MQVEWQQDDRTAVVTAVGGTVSVFDAERALGRARSLSASPDGARGFTRLAPDPDAEIIAINDQHPALRYPIHPADWLEAACAIVRRDLTRAEWERYLPGRPWAPTCTDLG